MSELAHDDRPVCVLTGGSSGIGLATGRLFAANGYQIATCARREPLLAEAAREFALAANQDLEVFVRQVDLNEPMQASQFGEMVIDRFGRIDVLINNAGFAPLAPFDQIDQTTFERVLNVNLRSVFHLTQITWKQMLVQDSGVIVNVSSLAAVDPFPGFSLYGASKAWLDLLTVALAAEGAEKGIRVCSIRPGAVETPLLRNLFPDFPAQQCVSPEDVAAEIWGCVNQPDKFQSGMAFEVTNQN